MPKGPRGQQTRHEEHQTSPSTAVERVAVSSKDQRHHGRGRESCPSPTRTHVEDVAAAARVHAQSRRASQHPRHHDKGHVVDNNAFNLLAYAQPQAQSAHRGRQNADERTPPRGALKTVSGHGHHQGDTTRRQRPAFSVRAQPQAQSADDVGHRTSEEESRRPRGPRRRGHCGRQHDSQASRHGQTRRPNNARHGSQSDRSGGRGASAQQKIGQTKLGQARAKRLMRGSAKQI